MQTKSSKASISMEASFEPIVIRALSYNIHGCMDANRRENTHHVYRIIDKLNADIIALQEVDGDSRSRSGQNQASIIGEKLNLEHVYFPTDDKGLRAFGLAVISRFAILEVIYGLLPSLHPRLNLRKRGALRVTLDTPAGKIHVINTHLSVYKLEGLKQIRALLKGRWLSALPPEEPLILCGDLNAGPSSSIYKTASRKFVDAQKAVNSGHSPKPTFHSKSTHWRIDHIFVSPHFTPRTIEVPRTPETQMASDHLPLAAELELPVQQAHPKGFSKADASYILQN